MGLFSPEEFQSRLQAVKREMQSRGLEAMVISDPANMNYLTGYDGWSFYVPQAVVILQNEKNPFWFGREQDANGARLTVWLAEESIISYEDHYIHAVDKHPMDVLAHFLASKQLSTSRIGMEADAYFFTAKSFFQLQQHLPNVSWVDATLMVNWLRMIKSPAEINLMRKAGRIVAAAMQVAIDEMGVGVAECHVAGAIMAQQIKGTPEYGGDYPAIVPILPSGKRTSAPHLTWTDRRYESGDAVNIEIAGCYARYHAPLSRSVIIGQPRWQLVDLAEVVVEGLQAALDAVRPGALVEDIEAAWQTSIGRHGYHKDSRMGYSVGINYPPDWGEHTVSIRKHDKTVLQPNMTLHVMPGMWLHDYGFELSETIRVTESGVELLTNFEQCLFVR